MLSGGLSCGGWALRQDCVPGVGLLVGPFIPVHSLWGTLLDLFCLPDPSLESVVLSVDDPGFVPIHKVVLSLTMVRNG